MKVPETKVRLLEAEATILALKPTDVLVIRVSPGEFEPDIRDAMIQAVGEAMYRAGHKPEQALLIAADDLSVMVVSHEQAEELRRLEGGEEE